MGSRQLRGKLFLFLCMFLAVAVMTINAQSAPPLSSSHITNPTGEKDLQIAAKTQQVLIVIFPGFGQAYSETRSLLENKGIKVLVASSSVEPISQPYSKLTVKPDMLLSQVRTAEYDAIVFIGGMGYPGDNADAIRIAKEGASEGKVLASHCYGISTLIKAGALNGKQVATIAEYSSLVQKAGATMSTAPVERDDRIITTGFGNFQKFAQTIADALIAGSE
jgi:putative intracellular protease/amidase